jgi:hypothetical protein
VPGHHDLPDYTDSHENDQWQTYAALTAAPYANEWLLMLLNVELYRLELVAERVAKRTVDTNTLFRTRQTT